MLVYTQETVKAQIGETTYLGLVNEADNLLIEARKMPLLDEYGKEKYFYPIFSLEKSKAQLKSFVEKDLKITPFDLIQIIFLAKVLFASKTEKEFEQRSGGLTFEGDAGFRFLWNERNQPVNIVIDGHINLLFSSISEKTLVSAISNFNAKSFGFPEELTAKEFFSDLFTELELPFRVFLERDALDEAFKGMFFDIPSLGFTLSGSDSYIYHHASAYLRAFLNLLRVAGFIHHGQMNFGENGIEVRGPTSPVILGSNSIGSYAWQEDEKKPWEKIPDGSLFLSFGYRGLSKMYLDTRTFGGIKKFILENKIIFDNLKNPWNTKTLNDIEPALDILSTVTQMPDLGAKVLLLYCCLEHLFVPKNIINDKKNI